MFFFLLNFGYPTDSHFKLLNSNEIMADSLTTKPEVGQRRIVMRPRGNQTIATYTILTNCPEMVLNPKYPHDIWIKISTETAKIGRQRTDYQWYRTWYDKRKVIDSLIIQTDLKPELKEDLTDEEHIAINMVKSARAACSFPKTGRLKRRNSKRKPLETSKSTPKLVRKAFSTPLRDSTKENSVDIHQYNDNAPCNAKKPREDISYSSSDKNLETKKMQITCVKETAKENVSPSYNEENDASSLVSVASDLEVDSGTPAESSVKSVDLQAEKYRHVNIEGIDFLLSENEDDLPILLALIQEDQDIHGGNIFESSTTSPSNEKKKLVAKHVLINEQNFSVNSGDDSPFIFSFFGNVTPTGPQCTSNTANTGTSNKVGEDGTEFDFDGLDSEQIDEIVKEQKRHNVTVEQAIIMGFYTLGQTVLTQR